MIWFTTGIETLGGIPLRGGEGGSEVGELPSTPKKVRFGGRECRHFNPEFATPPGPRVAPHGKMDNLRKAPCKERTTFSAGARNPETPGGGILRHREAEDRRPPADVVEPEGKAESAGSRLSASG